MIRAIGDVGVAQLAYQYNAIINVVTQGVIEMAKVMTRKKSWT